MLPDQQYQIQVLPADLSDTEWRKVFRFKEQHAKRTDTPLPDPSWQALKKQYLSHISLGRVVGLVRKAEIAFGTFVFYRKANVGDEFIFLQHDFLTSHLDQQLLDQILTCFLAQRPSAKYLVLSSADEKNDYLEQLFSLEISELRELFELEIDKIDRTLLGTWASTSVSGEYDDDIRIITEKELNPDLLDDYYAMISEIIASIEHKSRLFDDAMLSPERIKSHHKVLEEKGTHYLALFILKKQELIGYTEILIQRGEPNVAHQSMTGVRKGYRGSGLGKRLKALMIQRLIKEHPELSSIKTAIHIKNLPSQRLNRRLGFQKVGVFKQYIIPKESILGYL